MNVTVNNITEKWNPESSLSFATWYKIHIKAEFELKEDYILLKKL